jgi:hypothetical protein
MPYCCWQDIFPLWITVKPVKQGYPKGRATNVLNSEVSSFQGAMCTENGSLGPDELSLFHRAGSHRFHCIRVFRVLSSDM